MRLIKTDSPDDAVQALQSVLLEHLQDGQSVGWLLSGGSNIAVASGVMEQIPEELSRQLTISLVDERYGDVGHADSNWTKLVDTGFAFKQAVQRPVLQGATDVVAAQQRYDQILEEVLAQDFVLALYGMGADGHIAGILPGSPAVTAAGLTAHYVAEDYSRLTMTFTAMQRCHGNYLVTYGDNKRPALERLLTDASLDEQPAQIMKRLPDAHVYNDQIGGNQ